MKAKKKLWVRIFFIAITIIFILGMFFVLSNAASKSISTDMYKPRNNVQSKQLNNIISTILGVVHVIGIFVSVAMLMIMGIKYMMGSVEEKAEYKETMRPYLWGVILLIVGTTIIRLIYNLAGFMLSN